MKLMITADDYGMTPAVTDGIITCIREGLLTQTGLFTNMPSTQYAVNRMLKEFPDFCLGQDINFSTGAPVTDPSLIPSMVQDNGQFLTSSMHRQRDKEDPHHVKYEEAFLEGENQVKRFIELVGKKPDYIGGHAYRSDEIMQVLHDLAMKYDIPEKNVICAELETDPESMVSKHWVTPRTKEDGTFDFGMETQLSNSPLELFKTGQLTYFAKALKEDGIVHIRTHCGFVDHELMRLSSFHIIRMMEAEFVCSKELKDWVKANHVKLVSFKNYKD